jgi:hypothetical protein
MDVLTSLFGVEHDVSFFQECARAVLIFFYGLILLRMSGRRTFGRWSALDIIVSLLWVLPLVDPSRATRRSPVPWPRLPC